MLRGNGVGLAEARRIGVAVNVDKRTEGEGKIDGGDEIETFVTDKETFAETAGITLGVVVAVGVGEVVNVGEGVVDVVDEGVIVLDVDGESDSDSDTVEF